MTTVDVVCSECGRPKQIIAAEYRRRVAQGHYEFFCNNSCACTYRNRKRGIESVVSITKQCPKCGNTFETVSGKNEHMFCSRSCANSRPMTEERREYSRRGGLSAQLRHPTTIDTISSALAKREGWRYAELGEWLHNRGAIFRFEHPVGGYIFDLVLLDRMLCIEFDEPSHFVGAQVALDRAKDHTAQACGYRVLRIPCESNAPIPLHPVINYL